MWKLVSEELPPEGVDVLLVSPKGHRLVALGALYYPNKIYWPNAKEPFFMCRGQCYHHLSDLNCPRYWHELPKMPWDIASANWEAEK